MSGVVVKDGRTIRTAALEALKRLHPDWTVDELLVHPKDALELCRHIRECLGKRVSDDDICRTLLNARKQGYVK